MCADLLSNICLKLNYFKFILMNIKYIIVSALLLVGIASCGSKADSSKTEATTEANATTKGGSIKLTEAEFATKVMDFRNNPTEWKYLGDKPAIVDFYADWCAPCKVISPILEELAQEYDGQIYVYKVDTDESEDLARSFGLTSIPAILFIPQTGTPQMSFGVQPKEDLKDVVEKFLLAKGE